MKLLLDTHVFLWWIESDRLAPKAADLIADPQNIIYISSASLWEIVIKKALGKLKVKANLPEEISKNNFEPLPIHSYHVARLENLPDYHHDPFDRILIAQALHEGLKLVTHDKKILRYEVPTVLA